MVSAAAERGELTRGRVAGADEAAAAGSPGLKATGSTCVGRERRLAQGRRRGVLAVCKVRRECHGPRMAGAGRPACFAVRSWGQLIAVSVPVPMPCRGRARCPHLHVNISYGQVWRHARVRTLCAVAHSACRGLKGDTCRLRC